MFQKPTFGSTTSGFGSFNNSASTSSPFGGFKPAAPQSAFGAAPSFSGGATQPASTSGLFGSPSTGSSLFGASTSTAPAPAFGANTSFGASNTSGGLFGGTSTGGGGLFGSTQQQTPFGAKPAGFGFGGTSTANASGNVFGATQPSSGLFGQQNTSMVGGGGGGLFGGTTSAFGPNPNIGTGHIKYNPVIGTDVMVKSGTSQNINIKHHCITCMKEYEGKSLEELRLEDYLAGRNKGAQSSGAFSSFHTDNKSLFPSTSAFGQPATTAPSVFGGISSGGGGFGQTNTFSFGGAAQNANTSTSLFGANKPAFGATSTPGTGLFGATTTQPSAFGTNTSTFGFGSNTQPQSTGLFGAKPAPAFGATTSTFPSFGASAGTTNTGTTGGLFGSTAPAFNQPAQQSAFGTAAPAFGTATSSAGSLFGAGSTFNKPATQPTFGFASATPNTGLGLGGSTLGSSFGVKPGTGLGTGTGLFGTTSQPTTGLNFNTGSTSLGGGLGGFGNTSSLGNTSLGGLGGFGTHNTGMGNVTLQGSAVNNVHEQILTLAARPFGDSPLYKDLVPDSTTNADDALKPTNPAALQAVLSAANYRVSSPETKPRARLHPPQHKKSLFDGLEESDPSLEDKLSLKPSRKRLVLRPQQSRLQVQQDYADSLNRSIEEVPQPSATTANSAVRNQSTDGVSGTSTDQPAAKRDYLRGINTDLESSYDKNNSWMASSRMPWNDSREKPIDNNEATPRIYPDLEKELPSPTAERRASWLTTKPLRKPALNIQDSAENTIRELLPETRCQQDKDIDELSVSEEENVSPREGPKHPTGVKLTRPGYFTIPTLDDMISYIREDGRCVVPHLTVGRRNYGNVFFDTELDVTGLDLDTLIHFLNKEVIVYPDDMDKPPVGAGLNRRAIVTLDRVWPRDKSSKSLITQPERLLKMDYEGKLRRVCDKHDTKFIEYRPQTGSWVFRVEHFSKYGLTDSDEEDDIAPEVLKRQLVKPALQTNAIPVQPLPAMQRQSVRLGGLTVPNDSIDSLFAMQQTSLNVFNGTGRVFEMDTTEDHPEMHSLYTDNEKGVEIQSPSSELARLEHRHSHRVQLMKASLLTDVETFDDDISISTGDQRVPAPRPRDLTTLVDLPQPAPLVKGVSIEAMDLGNLHQIHIGTDVCLPPLLVPPHTVVLRYHRKIPPFKETIAGKLGASCIADMSVSRARHCRAGFGPRAAMAYVSTRALADGLAKAASLSDLSSYVSGRGHEDWSEQCVLTLALGSGGALQKPGVEELYSGYLDALLQLSRASVPEGVSSGASSPLWSVPDSAETRRELLGMFVKEAWRHHSHQPKFGVSGAYCYEVWKLCEALWAADLENDGVPATDQQSIVNRHNKVLEWLTAAVTEAIDARLSTPATPDSMDESDRHTDRIFTLLLGGRVVEACKVARDAGDLNLSMLIAQASGDLTFRALVSRQLSLWRGCGATNVISPQRLAVIALLAGETVAVDKGDWLQTLHRVARYTAQPTPSLEQIVTQFEADLRPGSSAHDEETQDLEISVVDEEVSFYPSPPYVDGYHVDFEQNGVKRRVLDLRYQLLKARAMHARPRLYPASYTPDPTDYSLCFLLSVWFGSITGEVVSGFCHQLEAGGAWHYAVLVAAYHPDDKARAHLIRSLLSRYVPAKADSPRSRAQLDTIRKINAPTTWLLEAQAVRAKYEKLPFLEAEYLVAAEKWNEAHKVLMEDLMPNAVLSNKLESLAPLLEGMQAAAARHEISGWERGGNALYNYVLLCREMEEVSSCDAHGRPSQVAQGQRLESLRGRIAALAQMPPPSVHESLLSRAARCSVLAGAATGAARGGGTQLALLLRGAGLPPAAAAPALHKITSELAEQVSALCMESATSTPISSRLVSMRGGQS